MKLFDFQEKGLERVHDKHNVAFYWDMGLGKTFVGTERMFSEGRNLNLIICQKSKIEDWKDHIEGTGKATVQVVEPRMKVEEFWEIVNGKRIIPLVLIVNYELIWRRSFFKDVIWPVVMLDESSIIQNDKAKVTKFILDLSIDHCILLSGTPCSGKYENLWSQAHLLGWGISRSAFDNTYVNWEKFYVGMAVHWRPCKREPYRNVERLKSKLREYGADFLKTDEVIDLPEQTYIPMTVLPSKDYITFRKERYLDETKTRKELIGDSTMAWRIGLRKLCSEYSESKFEAVKDLLGSTNERVIIFYNWTSELNILMTICSELGKPISIVNGKTKDLTSYTEEDDSVTLVQYQAGAMGLNLQKSRRIIYFSLPERSDLFEQSKKRIHRIGQKNTCFYYIPVSKGTIEKSIYKCLLERKDYTDELFKEEMK